MNEDKKHMKRCIELARSARDAGDHPFGAVLVSDSGEVMAEGRNREETRYDVTWHAEIAAIRRGTALRQSNCLQGATLYTNGEPCIMCSAAIRKTGITRVVFGAHSRSPFRSDPHPLTDPDFGDTSPPIVEGGFMEQESLSVQERIEDG